jgi:hypothetical protein
MIFNNAILAIEVLYKIADGLFFNWAFLFILCVFGLGFGAYYFLSSVSR